MDQTMKWILKHFQRYRERRAWDFCWRIALEGTIVALAASALIAIIGVPEREIDIGLWPFIVAAVLIAPIVETLVLQAFPVWIARLCKARFSIQIICSVVPFAILHAMEGVQAGVAAGLISGFYLAFTYAHWRVKRRWTAFWVTAVSHAIHNGLSILLAVALGEI
jgi:Type II CAAX prenyl endopeptidase Rce1-like